MHQYQWHLAIRNLTNWWLILVILLLVVYCYMIRKGSITSCVLYKETNNTPDNLFYCGKGILALILALQHFEVYGTSLQFPVEAYTDHNPLTFQSRIKNNEHLTVCFFKNTIWMWNIIPGVHECSVSPFTNVHGTVYYIVLNFVYETNENIWVYANHGIILTCKQLYYDIMVVMTCIEYMLKVLLCMLSMCILSSKQQSCTNSVGKYCKVL